MTRNNDTMLPDLPADHLSAQAAGKPREAVAIPQELLGSVAP